MKISKFLFGTAAFLSFMSSGIYAQTCKVELASIATSYEGECKKGLANGKGTATGTDTYTGQFKNGLPDGTGKYTWANGNVYEGEWKKGKKEGEGKLTTKAGSASDSVLTGFWKDDQYIGKFRDSYKVFGYSNEVTNVKISPSKEATTEKFVEITILEKGQTVGTPSISINPLTGSFNQIKSQNRSAKVYIVQFPFRGSLSYGNHTVDFMLNNPGAYTMTISVNPVGN